MTLSFAKSDAIKYPQSELTDNTVCPFVDFSRHPKLYIIMLMKGKNIVNEDVFKF